MYMTLYIYYYSAIYKVIIGKLGLFQHQNWISSFYLLVLADETRNT